MAPDEIRQSLDDKQRVRHKHSRKPDVYKRQVYIDGGPGSGKSESWIKGIIYQCAERNYAGFVYDWEGDP